MIYLFIFSLIFIFIFFEVNLNYKKKFKAEYYIFFFFIVFLLIVTAGIRTVGFDYENYSEIYNIVRISNYFENGIEYGFAFIISVFNIIDLPFFSFTIFVALISISLKSFFFNKYSPYPFISLLIYFSITFLISDMGQMRNGLALAIALWAFDDLFEERKKLFFFKIFCAFLIHSSAIIVFPAYFLLKKKNFKPLNMAIVLMFLFYFVFNDVKDIILFVAEKVNFSQLQSRVALYVLGGDDIAPLGLNLSLFLRIFVFLIMLYFYDIGKERYKNYEYLLRLYFYGICLYMIFNSVNEFAFRFSNYFKILECIILPMFVSFGKTRLIKNGIAFFIIIFSCYSIYKVLFDPAFGPEYLPYKNVLFNLF